MIAGGIDLGARTVKAVIMKDGKILGKGMVQSGREKEKIAEAALEEAIKNAKLARKDVQHITSTGAGRKRVPFANSDVTEIAADARGTHWLFPAAKTVIDIGAEEGRAIKIDPTGKAVDFAVNEKCAAGAGSFTESMSRALEIKVTDMGPLSLRSKETIPMNAQCAVFAESEVVSLVHKKTSKEDIARAVHDAIAGRISSMVRTVGVETPVALIGGVARNVKR